MMIIQTILMFIFIRVRNHFNRQLDVVISKISNINFFFDVITLQSYFSLKAIILLSFSVGIMI